jgi:UDP-glucose:(heptosyl)LPS alpha-1,3-glucosyltransferase
MSRVFSASDEQVESMASKSRHVVRPSIAILRQRYSPFGGGEEIIRQAADALELSGKASISVISRDWSPRQVDGVRFIRCDPPHWGRLMRELSFCSQSLRLARDGFDIVQSHERIPGTDVYRAGDGVYVRWLKNYMRVIPAWRRWSTRASPFHLSALALERKIYASPKLSAVIANSQMVADDIAHYFPHAKHLVRVIWNGVDVQRFSPTLRQQRAEVLRRHGLRDSSRVILFLGSGWVRKGLSAAIASLAHLGSDVHMIIVGRDRRQSMFTALAAKCGVTERVVFAGPREDPEAYLGAADALVLPSIYDPMPNSVLEAMATGIPVVVSSHTGAADLVRTNGCGLVCDPFVPEQWPAALSEALHPSSSKLMGDAGRKVALEHSLRRMTDEWLSLYRELLATRSH